MYNNLQIYFIKHSDLSETWLRKIIALKSQHWKYTEEDQKNWINKNISPEDYHLILTDNKNYILAYLNLVSCDVFIGNESHEYFGIGNVCVDISYQGQKFGYLIMDICKHYLSQSNKPGLLLCKDHLVPFYTNANWIKYNNKVFVDGCLFNNHLFLSNNLHSSVPVIKLSKGF